MAKLSQNNFFNTMQDMFGGDKVTADQLSDLLKKLVSIGFELPKPDTLKKWLRKPYDAEEKAAKKERDAEWEAYMKTVGKDKSKWTDYVEQLAGFSPVFDVDNPRYKAEYEALPNKNMPYEEWIKSKEDPAIFRTVNANPARIWYARYKEDPLRGPGYSIFPGMKRREPKEIINPKWLKEHADRKRVMDFYRDEYNEERTNKPFGEWLNERGETLNLPAADITDIRNHIIKQSNLSQDSDDPRVYTTIMEETPIAFVPLKEGENYKSKDAMYKLRMALDSNRPWIGQTAFGFVDPERREIVRKLSGVNGCRFSDAVKKLRMTPGRLAQFLKENGYGAEKSTGEIKKEKFIADPMDFDAIIDTMGDAPSKEDAEKRSKRALENNSYTRITAGSNGRQQRIHMKDGKVVSIQSRGSKTLHWDKKAGKWVEWTKEWKEKKDPKTGKTIKERVTEVPGSQNSKNRAEQMRKNKEALKKQLSSYFGGDEYKKDKQNADTRADRGLNKRYGLDTPTTDAEKLEAAKRAASILGILPQEKDLSVLKDTEVSDARMKNIGRFASAVSFRPGEVR